MKKIFTIFLFLICVEAHSKFNSAYNFTIAHPITTNSFNGKISTSFNYLVRKYFTDRPIPIILKTGVSYSVLTNNLNQNLNNIYLNTGFCKNLMTSSSIGITSYLTGGYSIFKDKTTNNYGFSMESGVEIHEIKYFHNYKIKLHFSYRQNFLNQFEYAPNSENQDGKFGMFLIGASCYF